MDNPIVFGLVSFGSNRDHNLFPHQLLGDAGSGERRLAILPMDEKSVDAPDKCELLLNWCYCLSFPTLGAESQARWIAGEHPKASFEVVVAAYIFGNLVTPAPIVCSFDDNLESAIGRSRVDLFAFHHEPDLVLYE
jgi:hypothetical protein